MPEPSLLQTLKAATRGLRYVSESDRPVKPFVWTAAQVGAAVEPDAVLRAVKKIPATTSIQVKTLAEFIAPMLNEYPGMPNEEKETAARFKALQELLTKALIEPKVYRIGEGPDIPAIALGKTTTGEWAGVETLLVET